MTEWRQDGPAAAASICAKFPATAKARWRRWARTCAPRACAGATRSPRCRRALKIRKDHLEALEKDRLEDLPGKTYAIGFVRSYARHLGLDATQYVERFKQEISGRADDTVARARADPSGRRPPPAAGLAHHRRHRGAAAGLWRLASAVAGRRYQPGRAAAAGAQSAQGRAPKPACARGGAAAQTATPSPATDAVPPPTHRRAPASRPPPRRRPPPAPQTPATQTSADRCRRRPPRRRGAPAGVRGRPAAQVYGAQNRNPRVVLRARGDTRITVRGADGPVLLNRDLKAGDSYQVPNTPGVTMATSNAGAVEVDLDGNALGRAGAAQPGAGSVSLDPQSLADRFNTSLRTKNE